MKKLELTAVDIAERFIGVGEIEGEKDNPLIMAMLTLDNTWPKHDEVPWCSAFPNFICHILNLPRSRNLLARSWLLVGNKVKHTYDARIGFDLVVLKRGKEPQPDASVIHAPGHVGFFYGFEHDKVCLLGANQHDRICVEKYSMKDILSIQRLYGLYE